MKNIQALKLGAVFRLLIVNAFSNFDTVRKIRAMRAVISRTLMKAIIIAFTGHFVLLIYLGLLSMLSNELNIDMRNIQLSRCTAFLIDYIRLLTRQNNKFIFVCNVPLYYKIES